MISVDQYPLVEKELVPLATSKLQGIIERNICHLREHQLGYFLNVKGQQEYLDKRIFIHKTEPSIVGFGKHQVALSLGSYSYGDSQYNLCAKLCRHPNTTDFGYMKDIMISGGSIENVPEGILCKSPYHVIISGVMRTRENMEVLQNLGFKTHFTTEITAKQGHRLTIAEDVSEGGRFYLMDALEYISLHGDKKLSQNLENAVQTILGNSDVTVTASHGTRSKDLKLDLKKMFFVRLSDDKKELIALDLDHIYLYQ